MAWIKHEPKYYTEAGTQKGGGTSFGGEILSKGMLLVLGYLFLTNIVFFSKQAQILLMVGVGIWVLLKL